MFLTNAQVPANLVGLGLRSRYIPHILANHHKISKRIGWFEVHSENYFADKNLLQNLLQIRQHFPISLHSVGNSLGSIGKIDLKHLKKLKNLIEIIDPFLVSDHISWGRFNNMHSNDLLPLPYNQNSLEAICANVNLIQDYLKRQILVENPSSYVVFKSSTMSEAEFIDKITQKTGCKLLLDVNNIYVSATNNASFDPSEYISLIDKDIVKEMHLAGHAKSQIYDGKVNKTILVDTHNDYVCDEVWQLFKIAAKKFANAPVLIEWDQDLPEFNELLNEAKKVANIKKEVC